VPQSEFPGCVTNASEVLCRHKNREAQQNFIQRYVTVSQPTQERHGDEVKFDKKVTTKYFIPIKVWPIRTSSSVQKTVNKHSWSI
jgi:hypothetical protein